MNSFVLDCQIRTPTEFYVLMKDCSIKLIILGYVFPGRPLIRKVKLITIGTGSEVRCSKRVRVLMIIRIDTAVTYDHSHRYCWYL